MRVLRAASVQEVGCGRLDHWRAFRGTTEKQRPSTERGKAEGPGSKQRFGNLRCTASAAHCKCRASPRGSTGAAADLRGWGLGSEGGTNDAFSTGAEKKSPVPA